MGAFLGKPPSLSYLPISSLTRKMIISFQCFSDKPKTEKYNESRVGGGLRYGLSSMQVLFKINFHLSLKKGKFHSLVLFKINFHLSWKREKFYSLVLFKINFHLRLNRESFIYPPRFVQYSKPKTVLTLRGGGSRWRTLTVR